MDRNQIGELAEDIKANGQILPIQLLDGAIIDGRRRYTACQLVGVEPKFEDVVLDDPVKHVSSLNLQRRHLTTSQRGMCASRAVELSDRYEREAKERQKQSKGRGQKGQENFPDLNAGQARDKVGADFKVSGKTVDRAKRVRENAAPEVVDAVDAGDISLNKADEIQEQSGSKEEQVPALKEVKEPKPRKSKSQKPKPPNHAGVGAHSGNRSNQQVAATNMAKRETRPFFDEPALKTVA